jgi:copper chaperone CopZ
MLKVPIGFIFVAKFNVMIRANDSFLVLGTVLMLIMGTVTSCSEPSAEVSHTEMQGAVDKTVAKLQVEGMMCEVACAGKIAKELNKVSGVASVSVDFVESGALNVAEVEYNPDQVSESDLINCVEKIAGGIYDVKSIEVIHYTGSQETNNAISPAVDFQNAVRMPGILDLLKFFLPA